MKDFVSFEIAKKLKEKGFRWGCLYRYRNYSKTLHPNRVETKFAREVKYSEFYNCFNSYIDNDIDAPTISQVLKWLREEKKIHICISYSDNINTMWEYEVILLDGALYQNADSGYNSYEEAAFAGIEYCLNNLI